jgi:hypothetical protein
LDTDNFFRIFDNKAENDFYYIINPTTRGRIGKYFINDFDKTDLFKNRPLGSYFPASLDSFVIIHFSDPIIGPNI